MPLEGAPGIGHGPIQRYRPWALQAGVGPDPDGEFVKFADADAREQALRAEIVELQAQVGCARSQVVPAEQSVQSQLGIAERIARQAHAGQVEESTGDDYIHHVERVVALVDGDEAEAVAWLHDVLEDSTLTCCDLTRAGISETVVNAVTVLTRHSNDTYAEYIGDVRSGTPLAIAVKLADLKDHLRPNCPERLRPRYERALAVLTGERVEPLPGPAGIARGPSDDVGLQEERRQFNARIHELEAQLTALHEALQRLHADWSLRAEQTDNDEWGKEREAVYVECADELAALRGPQ